jgi:leader peptidase (prepilin peptidase)/N-methyltransferase
MMIFNHQNLQNIFLLPSLFLLGMFIGNILNITATYLPHSIQQNLQTTSKSYFQCSHCQHSLSPLIALPFLRIFLYKNTCSHCQSSFTSRYLIVEFTTALISILMIYYLGLCWTLLFYLILTWGFILLVVIDNEYYLLPDIITLPLLWLGLLCNAFSVFTTTQDAVLGTITGYLSLYFIAKLFIFCRGINGLGLGDCKLFALFGAWWGIEILLPTLLVASLMGSAFGIIRMLLGKQVLKTPIPFGPYLIFAAAINVSLYL